MGMRTSGLLALAAAWMTSGLYAQVPSEEELFGGTPEANPSAEKPSEAKPAQDKPAETQVPTSVLPSEAELFGEDKPDEPPRGAGTAAQTVQNALIDKMRIGGRLELRTSASKEDQQRFQKGAFQQTKLADVYFDTQPNDRVRAYLRLRFAETGTLSQSTQSDQLDPGEDVGTGEDRLDQAIDQFWFKWDIAESLYLTVGKQHLKWGRGRIWNPTDFTAVQYRDPFMLFDQRLGQEMIKLHMPFEKSGGNLYAIIQSDDASRNDDLAFALRGELVFGDTGELGASFYTKRNRATRGGLDLGIGLGNFDVNAEAAWSTRVTQTRYVGELDVALGRLPEGRVEDDRVFAQTVLGLEYVWKYSDEDNAVFGVEGFWNQLGYDDQLLELYSLIQGQSQFLYSGRRYVGYYARAIAPGSWDKTAVIVNGLTNIEDETSQLRLTVTQSLFDYLTAEAYVSHCIGDYGELCFRITDEMVSAGQVLPEPLRSRVLALPTRVTRTVFGGGLSMAF